MKSEEKATEEKQKTSAGHRLGVVIGIILCVILIPMLTINVTLIIKSYVNTEDVPSVGGYLPLIVLTDSMYPDIQSGDLIICHTKDAEEVEVGDVIAFFDPAGNGTSVVTHQAIEITYDEEGNLQFVTKGIANNTADELPVPAENLVGVFLFRLPGVGNVAMFFQTTTGLIVCVIIPLVLLVGFDLLRRRKYEKQRAQSTDELLRELEELRKSRGEEK
ncbi:MAG: signal peptidase I [Clostridiales bacterium]|nr:signal peptidase I [Clostridiales bacterium]